MNVPSIAGLNNPGYNRNDRTLFTLGFTHKWNDKLTEVMETDQGMERAIPGLGAPSSTACLRTARPSPTPGTVSATGSSTTSMTRSWASGGRKSSGTPTAPAPASSMGDTYYEQTLGAQFRPYNWLWIRPEARYDWSQFHPAYSNDTRKSQLTLAFDVILLF